MQAGNRLRAGGRGGAASPCPPALTAKCAPGRGGRWPPAATLAGAAPSLNEDFLPFDSVAPHFSPLSCLVAVQPHEFGSWAKWSPAVFPSLASASALEMWPDEGQMGETLKTLLCPLSGSGPSPGGQQQMGCGVFPIAGGLGPDSHPDRSWGFDTCCSFCLEHFSHPVPTWPTSVHPGGHVS